MCFERPWRRRSAEEVSSKELWESFEREHGPVRERPPQGSEAERAEHDREAETEPARTGATSR